MLGAHCLDEKKKRKKEIPGRFAAQMRATMVQPVTPPATGTAIWGVGGGGGREGPVQGLGPAVGAECREACIWGGVLPAVPRRSAVMGRSCTGEGKLLPGDNSLAFGSAPGREADSQPISQLVRQAVSHAVSWACRQADRQTQPNSLGFFSDGLGYKQRGARVC